MAKIRPEVSESTYRSIRADKARMESYEDLQAVEARIDSVTSGD